MSLSSTDEDEISSSDNHIARTTFCKICQKIDFAANIDSLKKLGQYSPREDAVGWVLGALADVLRRSTECQLCALVHFLATKRIQEQGIEPRAEFEVSLEWTNTHFVKAQVVIPVVLVEKAQWVTLNDAFEPKRTIPGSDTKEILPTPLRSTIDISHTIELRHIEDKLKACDAHHGRHCQRNSHRAEAVPIFLIDTQRLRLVRSDTDSPYFTLSYRWGQTANAQLTRTNVDALMHPGGLHEIWPKIPRVVREAIQLVAQFDVYAQRYLWVDSLCILQDDAEHKHSQISHMGTIYHQASMTIVALSAVNADSALFASSENIYETEDHLGDVERQKQVRLVPDYRISTRLTEHVNSPDYIYRSRGWTFQEEKLSRRVLYCTDSGILFRCRVLLGNRPWWDDDWREKTATQTTLRTEVVRQWLSLVIDYSRRHFTYPSDTLRGFTGIADSLNHPVNGEVPLHVVCGVCIEWFPYSLYWRPKDLRAQKRHSHFPTWSWASCVGTVDFPNAWDFDFPNISGIYSTHLHTAQLIQSPIPLEFENDTANPNGNNSSFDSERSSIRKHARAVVAQETHRKTATRPLFTQSTVLKVDQFFMLKMQVRLKVLKCSSLGLTATEESALSSQLNDPHWSSTIDSYFLYRKKDRVGYTDVAPEVFEACKKDIFFIPLFKNRHWAQRVVFLVAFRVGKDLYERLGVGWGCKFRAWSKRKARDSIVYLI